MTKCVVKSYILWSPPFYYGHTKCNYGLWIEGLNNGVSRSYFLNIIFEEKKKWSVLKPMTRLHATFSLYWEKCTMKKKNVLQKTNLIFWWNPNILHQHANSTVGLFCTWTFLILPRCGACFEFVFGHNGPLFD